MSSDRDQVYNERQAYRGYVPDERNAEEILTHKANKIRYFYERLMKTGFGPDEALLLVGRLYVDF